MIKMDICAKRLFWLEGHGYERRNNTLQVVVMSLAGEAGVRLMADKKKESIIII